MANEQLKRRIDMGEALQNALCRNIVEQAIDFVIVLHDMNDRGRVVYANDAACQHFGADRATLLTWTAYDLDPLLTEDLFEDLQTQLLAGQTQTFEAEHQSGSGERIPVEVFLHPIQLPQEDNEPCLCVSFTHDIRERRAIEEQRRKYETALARQKAEKLQQGLIEAWPYFIVGLDTEAKLVYINTKSLEPLGFDLQQSLGKTALEMDVTGDKQSSQRLHESTLRCAHTGEPQNYQDWWQLPFGKRCVDIHHIPQKDEAGQVVGVLGMTQDITERTLVDNTLQFIAQRGWSSEGESFLTTLTRYLGETLNVDYIIIDKLADDDLSLAETVAVFAKGEILPNLHYKLDKTPCENVMEGSLCCYPQDVQRLFPEDDLLADMGVESYIGLPLWDSFGKPIGLIACMDSKPMSDETVALTTQLLKLVTSRAAAELERARSEQQLQARERDYRRLLDNSPDIIVRYDQECRRTFSNEAHRKLLGKPIILGQAPVEDLGLRTYSPEVESYQAHLQQILDSGEMQEWELNWHDDRGNPVYSLVRGVPEFGQDGKVSGVLVIGRDITTRTQVEAARLAREQEFRTLVENSPDFVTRFDRDCRHIYVNPTLDAAEKAKTILGKTPTECYPDNKEAEEYEKRVFQTLKTGRENQCVVNFSGKDGLQHCLDIRIAPERNTAGDIISVLAIGRDIREQRRLEEELRRQASYDVVTGLPNRWLFSDRLQEEINRANRNNSSVTLLFIDLDHFKEVNDTLGHETGDLLLKEVAQRIQACLRKSDTVARLGGDEFVAILPEGRDVTYLGNVAQKIIDVLGQAFFFNNYKTHISASIGIASYPADADNAETLLSCADQAMYYAKEGGRKDFHFFTASMQRRAEGRLNLANSLRQALSEQQFQLHYQPIIDTTTGRVIKAEALLRWQHPEQGLVLPDQFIPIAEETDLIHDLGDWVFQEAVKTAALWRAQSKDAPIQISVNISPRQFLRRWFLETWVGYLADMAVPPECMVIEITEGLLLDDQSVIHERLNRLRQTGIQLALDDFGTGYSSMSYLKKFSVDYLKVDRSFVRDMETDDNDRAIAETIVIMARRLGMKTIAEGVETTGQRDILAAVGCEFVQGYLFAKPMPTDEFLKYAMASSTESNEA